MRNNIKAVIFDMDGLMFDTERIYQKAWIQAGREAGLDITEPFLATLRGGSHAQVKARFLECFGNDLDFERLRARRIQLTDVTLEQNGVPVKTGLRELLQFLKQHRLLTALASSSPRATVLHHLTETALTDFFSAIVTGDMVTVCKPDPEIFLKAAKTLDVHPGQCMVLEDSINGIYAAHAGGFLPVMVPDLTEPDQALQQLLYARCTSLLDVIPLLE